MKIHIDTDRQVLRVEHETGSRDLPLYSPAAFEVLANIWLKVGWNQKYTYTFTWLGRPIIQLPEDILRYQEVVYSIQPDVIVETGIAHGGSLVFSASLLKVIGRGRVIGVDIEIRPHNRAAIEAHELSPLITLIEGDSIDPSTIAEVKRRIAPGESALVVLDSRHTKEHVYQELLSYHDLVSPGSYIVATDGIMRDLTDVPRGDAQWIHDNPAAAAEQFAREHPEFVLEQPRWPFNESGLSRNVTHWPNAWLKRRT